MSLVTVEYRYLSDLIRIEYDPADDPDLNAVKSAMRARDLLYPPAPVTEIRPYDTVSMDSLRYTVRGLVDPEPHMAYTGPMAEENDNV